MILRSIMLLVCLPPCGGQSIVGENQYVPLIYRQHNHFKLVSPNPLGKSCMLHFLQTRFEKDT